MAISHIFLKKNRPETWVHDAKLTKRADVFFQMGGKKPHWKPLKHWGSRVVKHDLVDPGTLKGPWDPESFCH